MLFLELPAEIRLKVYSELLVLDGSIPLVLEYTLLRLNKQTLVEASPVLYSRNVFRFPNFWKNIASKEIVHTGVFLSQIGSNASLIRHLSFPCPPNSAERDSSGFFQIPAGFIRNLEVMKDRCLSLSSLQLTMPMYVNIVFAEWPVAANLLDLLAPYLKDIESLEDVIIELLLFDKIRNPSVDVNKGPLLRNIRDRGWTVQVTYAPSPQG